MFIINLVLGQCFDILGRTVLYYERPPHISQCLHLSSQVTVTGRNSPNTSTGQNGCWLSETRLGAF